MLTRPQYALMISALTGTIKGKSLGTAKLLGMELNRLMISAKDGEARSLERINAHLIEDLDEDESNAWDALCGLKKDRVLERATAREAEEARQHLKKLNKTKEEPTDEE